jgi:hypothetical protein
MKEEVWRDLPKAKLPGCYNRLIKLISWFDDPVRSTRADREEARANHDGIQAPDVGIITKSANLKVAGFSKILDSV